MVDCELYRVEQLHAGLLLRQESRLANKPLLGWGHVVVLLELELRKISRGYGSKNRKPEESCKRNSADHGPFLPAVIPLFALKTPRAILLKSSAGTTKGLRQ